MWKVAGRRVLPIGFATMIPLAPAMAQFGEWAMMRNPNRSGPVVFDGARGRLVLFGASNVFSHPCQTFEWNGAWQQRTSAHMPPLRGGHAMAYDAARRRVVLFGGVDGVSGTLLADTWLWDGLDWTRVLTAIAPPARQSAAMAFDDLRSRIVLFGGSVSSSTVPFFDTWLWDGAAWTQAMTSVQPQAREQPVMAFDRARGVVLLFGGRFQGSVLLHETWTWDGTQWTWIPTSPPSGVVLAMASDDARGRVVLHTDSLNTYEWDGQAWTLRASWIERVAKSMSFDANRGRVVGYADGGMVLEWNGTAWTVVDNEPSTWSGSWKIFSNYRNASLTLIGWSGGPQAWSYAGQRWQRVYPSTGPQSMGLMAGDSFTGRVVQFGVLSGLRNETWEWNGVDWRLVTPVTSPPARNYGGLVFQPVGARMILFGGMLPDGTRLNDTWTYDGVTWTQMQPLHRPPPRNEFGIASDLFRNRVVIFGGIDSPTIFGDTWEWDGTDWALRAMTGPSPRWGSGLDFDLARGNILLFGGAPSGGTTAFGNNDTWAWDGVAWRRLQVTTPPVPAPGAMQGMTDCPWNNGHVVINYGSMLSLQPGPFATAIAVGTGCGGSSGPLQHGTDLPYLGNSQFALEVHNLFPCAPCLVAVSTAMQPVDLGSGCTSYPAQPFGDLFLALANAAGVAQVRIPIPASTTLLGAVAFTQAGALDLQGPLGGIALSNAMQLTIGR